MKKLILLFMIIPQLLIAQDPLTRLEESPRHHEWVNLDYAERELKGFLVFPEVSEKAPVVIVIHENRGLNDWARSMADQIAEAGYIALAPDLLWGSAEDGKGTSSFNSSDEARTALYDLDPDQVTKDLKAAVHYAKNIESGNGKVAVIGFCWGGSQAFRFATNCVALDAVMVCYGTGPGDPSVYENISAPVYGFYGGNDNRVNASIEKTVEMMEANDKFYEPVIYEGAGHGFFRAGESEDASEANRKGREEGLDRLWKILSEL